MTTYQRFQKLNIEHSAIGMDQSISDENYFCTPIGAEVIGEAGVDGIHYCFIEGFGEMVFAVNPLGIPGKYVHPIAKNFEDLLKLLLACGSMAAIDQTYMWDEELFDQYVMDNQPEENQQSIMNMIKEVFQITPMENSYHYIKELQRSFDYSKLVFSEEYYEIVTEMEASKVDTSKVKAPEWKVTYEGGFFPKRGRAGKEIRLNREFIWGNEVWHIPAVYLCTKGIVVDFCVEVDVNLVKEFINKWNLYQENGRSYTNEEYEQIQEENPLNMEFQTKIFVNDIGLLQAQGCGVYWISEECMPDDMKTETEAKWILEHYGYDLKKAWAIHRISYSWTEKKPKTIEAMKVKLEREMAKIPCTPFIAPKPGENHVIKNPSTGVEYIFSVLEYEEKEMEPSHFKDDSMEWPTKYAVMNYTLFPELDNFYLKDSCHGDSPRRKQTNSHGIIAASVGIIELRMKAEDGEKYYHPDGTVAKLRVGYSSMYFENPKKIEWKLIFQEKKVPDMEIQLI